MQAGYFPGINTIRLWLSHEAFIRNSQQFKKNFEQVLALSDKYEIKFIVTLFNGWHSCPDFGGMSAEQVRGWGSMEYFTPYLEKVVLPHSNDNRILLWDLCNEPFNSTPGGDTCEPAIADWLSLIYKICKEYECKSPICVGSVPAMNSIKTLEPISDVITIHPYYAWNEPGWSDPSKFESLLDQVVDLANEVGKPLLATETCWGALDDDKRVETMAVELKALTERGIGFTTHLLHETLVADGHRPQYGYVTGAGYMAFINMDGSLRKGHELFNDF